MRPLDFSCDPSRLDRTAIHAFLQQQSHWATGLSRAQLDRAIAHSLCFGAYHAEQQLAFARVITDHATFAYLSDVFVLPHARGHGIGRALLTHILQHDSLQDLRRLLLCSRDARPFYAQLGFTELQQSERYMQWQPSSAVGLSLVA